VFAVYTELGHTAIRGSVVEHNDSASPSVQLGSVNTSAVSELHRSDRNGTICAMISCVDPVGRTRIVHVVL